MTSRQELRYSFWMRLYETEPASAERNMEIDRELLAELKEPILHLYEWDGLCATYGHFVRPKDHLDLDKVEEMGLQLAKRPTGGGIVFHTCDLAFSVLLPASHPAFSSNTLENYRWVNQRVIEAVREFAALDCTLLPENAKGPRYFCMARPTIYDVVFEGKKIGGAAQRKTREGFLHQGTIALSLPTKQMLSLLQSEAVAEAMLDQTHPLKGDKIALKRCLVTAFNATL